MKPTFMEPSSAAIYDINISDMLGQEYISMFNDMARFIIIQVAIQLMLCTMNPDRFKFFSGDFFMLLLFVVIGVLMYWLVFKKIFNFK